MTRLVGAVFQRDGRRIAERFCLLLAAGVWVALTGAGPVLAHAEYKDSRPPENATVDERPDEISIVFTEPPAGNAEAEVKDGCGRDVSGDTVARGENLIVSVVDGEPGEWAVGYSVVSLVDGHRTRGGFSFTVAGSADCESVAGGEGTEEANDAAGGRSGPNSAQLILVGITSALVAVFTMLFVATLMRARNRDEID